SGLRDRYVVRASDGDDQVGGRSRTLVIGDGVRNSQRGGLTRAQRLVGGVGGVERVGTVGVERQAGKGGAVQGVVQHRVRIHIGRDDRARHHRRVFGDREGRGLGHWRVVRAGDGDD